MILTIDQKWIFFTELSKMYKEKRREGNKALRIRGPPKKMQHIQLAKPKNQSSTQKIKEETNTNSHNVKPK